jgi:hypothetical protein
MSWRGKLKLLKSKYTRYVSCLVVVTIFFTFAFIGGTFGITMLGINLGLDTGTSGTTTGDDSLDGVKDIPDSLKPIFTAAGNKHKVSPAFIAAIFWKEHGEKWPTKGPWASSPKGANGPFQFVEKTWEGWTCKKTNNDNGIFETNPSKICGYGQDGDGDGVADVQNLTDAAFSASDQLGANGAAPYSTDLGKLRDSASLYNSGKPWSKGRGISETADYVPAVIKMYQELLKQM